MKGQLKYIVLRALEKENMSGYKIMSYLEKAIGWKPSPGSVYPVLKDLLTHKWVSVKLEGKKKIYKLNIKGKQEINAFSKRNEEFLEHIRKNISAYEKFADKKETKDMIKFHKQMTKGELPFKWLTPELIEIRKEIVNTIGIKDETKKKLAKKILKDTTKKLKELRT